MKPFFQAGQTVLFQGDSVTDCGRDRGAGARLFRRPLSSDGGTGCGRGKGAEDLSTGYPGKVAQQYHALFPGNGVRFVNRGVSGDRARNLAERYEADFRAVRPDFVSILIGINDTWRRYDQNDPTTGEAFAQAYRTVLTRLRSDFPQVKIMLIEPFLLPADPGKAAWREDLDPKIQQVRALAHEFADYYLPLDGILNALSICPYDARALAADGVHPTDCGHTVIAWAYLKTLGIL